MTAAARHMARALELAARGKFTTHPNPRVGCVIVRDGRVVGEGWHRQAGEPHAEVLALREAGDDARGAEVYVTLEPCAHVGRTPPCADALVAAGVGKVFAAMRDPFPRVAGRGLEKLRAAGIEVEVGIMEGEARVLNRGFVSRFERGRPYLILKLAMSLDGRTAMASGESRWITGEAAREDVHRLRAEAGAVLTTSATVLADDPELTVRLPPASSGAWRQPDRIVIDSRGRVPLGAKVWALGARRFALVPQALAGQRVAEGVETIGLEVTAHGAIPLPAALRALGAREINEVLVECGPRLAGALLQAGLVDQLVIYVAPKLLGDAARPLVALPGLERLGDHIALEYVSAERIGDDMKITARVAEKRA